MAFPVEYPSSSSHTHTVRTLSLFNVTATQYTQYSTCFHLEQLSSVKSHISNAHSNVPDTASTFQYLITYTYFIEISAIFRAVDWGELMRRPSCRGTLYQVRIQFSPVRKLPLNR